MKRVIYILIPILLITTSITSLLTGREITKLKEVLGEKSVVIEELTGKIEELNNEKQDISNKVKDLEEELSEKDKNYDELNKKYQEEITPVSYNPSNLNQKSNASTHDMKKGLKGTGLESLAENYVEAEKEYGVNAIFLASLTAQESAWGTSNRARTQNNLSGFEVYSAGAKGRYFDSKRESILTTAKLLANLYLNPNGSYYRGKDIYSVNYTYCPNDNYYWSKNINQIAEGLVQKMNS